jgi:MraZ protein
LFLGRFVHSLDDKRRIALPKAFRDEIDEGRDGASLFLVPGLDLCLTLFTQKRFEVFRKRLSEMQDSGFGQGHKNVRALRRDIFSGSTKLTPDKQGRIALPEDAGRRVGIEREVVFLGVDEKIELWSPRAEEVRDEPERLLKLGRELIG